MKNTALLLFALVVLTSCRSVLQESGTANARTPAEWMEIIRQDPEGPSRDDPELAELEFGTVMYVDHWKPVGDRQVNAARAFDEFMEGRGADIQRKWLAGETLSPEEQKYIWIVRAHYLAPVKTLKNPHKLRHDGYKPQTKQEQVFFDMSARAFQVIKKGCLGGKLSEAELDDLRFYLLWCSMVHGRRPYLPYNVGISRYEARDAGDDFPDFRFRTMESIVDSPGFEDCTEEADRCYGLKPKGVLSFLQVMTGFEPRKNENGELEAWPLSANDDWMEDEEGFVRISDYRGKPVVLFSVDMKDVFFRRIFPMLEPVYQAYKDKVQFFIVNSSFDDWGFLKTYYGGSVPHYYHDYVENAQAAKQERMKIPNVSVPVVLDDAASSFRNALSSSGGGGTFIIIDKTGKVAYENPSEQSIGLAHDPGAHCLEESLLVSELETELQLLLANGGCFDKRRGPDYINPLCQKVQDFKDGKKPEWGGRPLVIEYKRWPSGRWTSPLWLSGTVDSVDEGRGEITVIVELSADMPGCRYIRKSGDKVNLYGWAVANMDLIDSIQNGGPAAAEFILKPNEKTEFLLNGEPADFSVLRKGDKIGFRYGYLPPELKDSSNPDSKNFKEGEITVLPDGSRRVCPEQIRIFRM